MTPDEIARYRYNTHNTTKAASSLTRPRTKFCKLCNKSRSVAQFKDGAEHCQLHGGKK